MIIQEGLVVCRVKWALPAWGLGAIVAVYILVVLNSSLWQELQFVQVSNP